MDTAAVPTQQPLPPAIPSAAGSSPIFRFAYSLGRVEPRSPSLSVEKEIAQALGPNQADDHERLQRLLADPANRYLVRSLCWVFSVSGQDAFVVVPADPTDWALLPQLLRRDNSVRWVDVVIGHFVSSAPGGPCAALGLPVVHFDRLHSFSPGALLEPLRELRRAGNDSEDRFEEAFEQVFALADDNLGMADADRALNYLVLRYPDLYQLVADKLSAGQSLDAVRVRPAAISGARRILDVIFSFVHGTSGLVSQHFARVDITEEFPFLVAGLAAYVEH